MIRRLTSPTMMAGTAAAWLAALVFCLPWFAIAPASPTPAPAQADQPPLFAKSTPAENPPRLCLVRDERKVLGWIGGRNSYAGRQVAVSCGEGAASAAIVQADNTFTWHYRVAKPTDATFTVGELSGSLRLTPGETLEPAVFVVVDRSVYRPGQALRFAAFLRRLDENDRFVPIAPQDVEVRLTALKKQTVAAKLRLRSDEAGRLAGEYTFSEADALDAYELSAVGFKGAATVTLAEFRKSKIKLKIAGAVADGKLDLTFDAVDFTDKHVSASRVDVNVQIVLGLPAPAREGLKGGEFVYADDEDPNWDEDGATAAMDDAALLAAWQPVGLSYPAPRGPVVLAQMRHSLELAGRGQARHSIDLQKDWLERGCSVLVEGVVTDRNGREQRAVERIDLAGPAAQTALRLDLPDRDLAAGEAFAVTARLADGRPLPAGARSTAVVLQLAPVAARYGYYGPYSNVAYNQFDQRYFARSLHSALPRRLGWRQAADLNVAHHQFVQAVPFDGDHVQLSLDESGPYRIVVSTRLPDGRVIQEQAGTIVRPSSDVPRLILRLDKRELAAGEKLTGRIDSAFAGARVLLTLRDSHGVRWWQTLQLEGSSGRFSLSLPPGLSYGCSLAVQYPTLSRVHVAQQIFRVRPDDRTLRIDAKTPADCRPGQKVRLDFQVNRNEPVDLVVSVYDQSLLAVAPDRRTDIRDFFLADLRAADQAGADLLRRRLGELTVEQAVAMAKAAKPSVVRDDCDNLLQAAASVSPGQNVNAYHVMGLLESAGIAARYDARWGCSWYARVNDNKQPPCRLADLLDARTPDGTYLRFRCRGGAVCLEEVNPRRMAETARNIARYAGQARYQARGDAHFSASANAMYSASGQSFISHMPAGPAIELIQPDATAGQVAVRTDFSDSACWNAKLRTDANGRAVVEFKLPDSITNWHVVATAVSRDMHVGQHKTSFRSTRPIMVWPMVPRVFVEGDRVRLFAAVHNTTDRDQTLRVRLKVDNGSVLDEEEKLVVVAARSDAPVYWTFTPGTAGFTQLLMTATCPAGSDASLKRLPVVCPAAEELITRSGYCKAGAELDVPADVDLAKASLDVVVVPSLAADMADTLEYLVEYPHGCVEQTMSRFLPAIKVAQILNRYRIEHPGLKAKLPGCVDAGIKRLLQLQQQDGGWGWQGSGQTHEMMTPYALYGLLEARAAGYGVDEKAIQRGLNRLKAFIDAMGQPQAADRIYCMYVWSFHADLEKAWWDFIEAEVDRGKLSDYALALSLEVAARKGRGELAARLATALRKRVREDSNGLHWATAGFSRWGDDPFEITAAVLKAFAVHDGGEKLIPGILDYFARTKRGNRWNSTKDTAMVLFAMCEYLFRQDGSGQVDRKVRMTINDGPARTVDLSDGLTARVRLEGAALKSGRNVVAFEKACPGTMFRLVLRHRRSGQDLAPSAVGVSVARRLTLLNESGQAVRELRNGDAVPRGSYLLSSVSVQKQDGATMRYLLVCNPKPSSAEIIPADDKRFTAARSNCVLREDKTVGVLFHHEQTGNVQDSCVFLAEMAGEYVLPPAQAEMMYDSDVRGHSGTFRLKVVDEQPAKVASATK